MRLKKIVFPLFFVVLYVTMYGQSTKNYKIRSYFTMDVPTTLELRDTPGVTGQQYCFWPGLSSNKYARILVTIKETPGISQNDLKNISGLDLMEVKQMFLDEIKASGMSSSQVKIKVNDVRKAAGKYAIIKIYTRPGLNGDVYVETYDFYMGTVAIQLTLSYRVSESLYWKSDFEKVLGSIVWKI